MKTLNIKGETKVVKFTDQVYKRGNDLEVRVENYLSSQGITYKRSRNNGIDFIINGGMHLDCVAQGVSGTIGDKLPHKCWKYIRKYNLKDIYILHPYSPIKRDVGEHLEEIEVRTNSQIHVLDWKDFTYIMEGGKFEKRKPYTYSRDGRGVSHLAPTNRKLNEFFSFK
jgi:hypothetical protein